VIRGLGQRIILRANQSSTIEFTPERPGDYAISCSMNMTIPAKLRVT
jgi:plastocyanin domain-containing protein